jgi:hypothetical protein
MTKTPPSRILLRPTAWTLPVVRRVVTQLGRALA